MKRVLTLVLTLAMVLSLAACGGGNSGSSGNAGSSGSSGGSSAAEGSGAQPESGSESSAGSGSSGQAPAPAAQPFQEVTVVDNEACAIRITGIDAENIMGYTVKVTMENRSPELTYMFSLSSAAINGVECTSLFADEVAPGKTANGNITFADSDLKENGVGTYTDIELSFRVYDSNDWLAEEAAEETVHLYPLGEENATVFVRESQPGDNVLLDSDQATVIVTGYEQDPIWGYTANLYLLNKTDSEIMVSAGEVSVNGIMLDPFFAHSVPGGRSAFASMSWSDRMLEENQITTVENIEFKLTVRDNGNWVAEPYAEIPVVLNP